MLKIRTFIERLDGWLFGGLRDQHVRYLECELADSRSVLDVGCGANSPLGRLRRRPPLMIGVDAFQSAINQSRAKGIHDDYLCTDVLEVGRHYPPRSFDVVLGLDLIEHLNKDDGYRLIDILERLARGKVIFFTPNGFQAQHEADGNPYQLHRSGWEVEEMRARGYRVVGMNGWKPLRGELAAICFRPHFLWERISLATQLLTTHNPTYAFHILCVKDLNSAYK